VIQPEQKQKALLTWDILNLNNAKLKPADTDPKIMVGALHQI